MNRLAKSLTKSFVAFVTSQYVVLLFSLSTGVKFYIFNTFVTKTTWDHWPYLSGIICGYTVAFLIFSPIYFTGKYKVKISLVLAFILSVLLLVDSLYFSYYRSLPSVGLMNIAGQTTDILPAISTVLKPEYFLFFADIVLFLFIHKPLRHQINRFKHKFHITTPSYKTSIVALCTVLVCFVIVINTLSWKRLSDVFERGYDTYSTSQYYGVFLAQMIDTARYINQELTHLSPERQKQIADWVKNNSPKRTDNELTGIAKGKNIIMIQVESLGAFVIDQKINEKDITPNLNKLSKESHFFPNDRFLYGAGHTSDSDFVANTSFFPLDNAAIFVRYGRDNFTGLPKTLLSNGYKSAYAYHGFNRNFWNREEAFKSLGYQKFYAADNYPDGKRVNMGLNDGDFLSKTAEYINKQPKPSFSYAITLSSHVPFWTNSEMQELGIKLTDYPNQVGGYLENINYVDRMLGKFFEKLKNYNLYDDSLIVLYGDHVPVLTSFEAGTIKYDPDSTQGKEVPLMIKLPNQITGQTYPLAGAHLDIMPTILDLAGVRTKQLMFGQSLFTRGDNALKVCSEQLVSFKSGSNCKSMLETEKLMSAEIIRYNQFNNLAK